MTDESEENLNRPWPLPAGWAFGLLLLVLATWPLWFPGPSPQLPLIPLFPLIPWGSAYASWIAHAASFLLVVCLLLLLLVPPHYRPWLWWTVSGCLIVSFLVDQHRLQPWAYQSAIYAMVFASMDRDTAKRWLIPLAASIYLYSAAGKFDYQFAHTVGQDFLKAATDPLGGIPGDPGEATRARLALLFPTIEFLAGIGILVPRTRRAAAILVIAMHVGLIAMLGPWNRNHSGGVLLWNLLLIGQAYALLLQKTPSPNAVDSTPASLRPGSPLKRIAAVAVRLIIVVVLVAPLLERYEYWDHWTSWSLYSPHTSHVDIELHQTAVDRLDPRLRDCFREDTDQDGWRLLDSGRWSLTSRRVPPYPQARYQLGLAADIAMRYQLNDEIRARLLGVSDRWSGKRSQQLMRNRDEIESATDAFWLLPRRR